MTRSLCTIVFGSFLLLAACDAPVVGKWESDKWVADHQRNQLVVKDDNRGEALIWATPKANLEVWEKFRFNVRWEEEDEGTQFDFALDCSSDNCFDDFVMRCYVVSENDDLPDNMDCHTNNALWKDYPLDWERVSD